MAGLEIIGMIATAVEILDTISKMWGSIQDANGYPGAFSEVAKRIPVLQDSLRNIKLSMNGYNQDEESYRTIKLIMEGFIENAKRLAEIFRTVISEPADSRINRYSKSVRMVGKSGRVETLMGAMLHDAVFLTSLQEQSALFKASKLGDRTKVIEHLQTGKVEPDSKDSLSRTPLSYAAESGQEAVVKLLLEKGAVIDSSDDRGRTPLSYAAESGNDGMVKMLLQYGAVPNVRDLDGLTAEDYVAAKKSDPDPGRRKVFEDVEYHLENPPTADIAISEEVEWPLEMSREREEICTYFRTHIELPLSHNSSHNIPVWELIYGKKIPEVLKQSIQDFKPRWKWVNLPANNKLWVTDLVKAWYKMGYTSTSIGEIELFAQSEFRGATPHASFRQAKFITQDEENFSLVIPYFNTETKAYLDWKDPNRASTSFDGHFHKMEALEDAYNVPHNQGSVNLYISRTLDQSFYLELNDMFIRDMGQVIYRYTGGIKNGMRDHGSAGAKRREKKILMVSQLWLWKIGDTIITSFPEEWCHRNQFFNHIQQTIKNPANLDLKSMILRIMDGCIRFLDETNNAGLDENWRIIFEHSIARESQTVSESFKTFLDDIRDEKIEKTMKKEEQICDISEEMESLRLIKNVRDELNMIDRVLQDQMEVISSYLELNKRQSRGQDSGESQLAFIMQLQQSKVKAVDKEAVMVENSLKQLLDLKQKQGNLFEARNTRKLADEADKRAKESEKQSILLLIFTVVTVFFTPMSFVAAFLTIPSQDFPTNNNAIVSWREGQIKLGLGMAELATVVTIAATWAAWFIIARTKIRPSITKTYSSNTTVPVDLESQREKIRISPIE